MNADSNRAGKDDRPPALQARRTAWWNARAGRAILYQLLVVAGVVLIAAYLVANTLANLETRSIATGFGFLHREAGFGISETIIRYSPADTYLRALAAGLLNTLLVSVLGIVLATILGTIAGVARLSRNWLVARLAMLYVESLRNIPVLLQLFFWYSLITETLPTPRQALSPVDGVYLSNRGLFLPVPAWSDAYVAVAAAFALGLAGAWAFRVWARKRQERTGQALPVFRAGLALVVGLPVLAWLLGGAPAALDVPELRGFNFQGGVRLTPELAALLIGLVAYTGTFIAEIVRGGILAVARGQTEAGLALGLRQGLVLRLIVLPQAMRVIVPPLTSQYLNLTKNSSLAVAIGYPDLVSVANTAINQTGQAVEGIAIIMAVYLTVSLAISALMNWHNRRIALKGGGAMSDPRHDETPERIFAREEEPPAETLYPQPIETRPSRRRVANWLRANLFSSIPSTLLTIACVWLLIEMVPPLIEWALVDAVWSGADPARCRAAEGACWAFIEQKHRFVLFGLFPYEEHWRPLLAVALFIAAIALSCYPGFWRPWLAVLWTVTLGACAVLMWGGVLGLTHVDNERWGGLPLTLILATVGILCAFPLSILLALGRRSEMPAMHALSVGFIELIRGVPLISVLFMASVMVPLFLPEGVTVDKLLRALIGIVLFTAAYLAEAIRGGLQSIPRGQFEAADALGLSYWKKTILIILPQALKIAIPPIVNQFISMFKDTSLVIIIGLFDLLTTAKTALTDPPWRPFYIESYVFAGIIYWAFSFFMSRYSLFLERRLSAGTKRA